MDKFENWNELYKRERVESMPWYSSVLDHDLKRTLEKFNLSEKTILNLGEGPGTQAIAPWRLPDDLMRLRSSRTDYPPGGRTRSNLRLMRLPVYILKVSTVKVQTLF